MATAKRLPSGNYRVNLYIGKDETGKRIYKSFTGPDKKKIEAEAALFLYKKSEREESGLTVGESIDAYISSRSNILSPSTIRKYKSMRRTCYAAIQDKYIEKIKTSEIQAFVNDFSLCHAPKTVDCMVGLLIASLKSSCPDRSFQIKRPAHKKTKFIIPTDKQIQTLISEAVSAHIECAFILGAALGLRRSEISALTWADIDGEVLHVNKALVQDQSGEWIEKSTKTAAGTRDIPIPKYLVQKLLSIKPDGAKQTDRIIPISPNALTKAFNRAKKRAGITCRLHDLRHYNASVMLALGVPDKYAMERMGHATPNMLKNVYQHIIDEKQKEVADLINEKMKGIIK